MSFSNWFLTVVFENFIQTAIDEIPQFTALKFSDPNLVRYESCQSHFGDKVRFFAGMNEVSLVQTVIYFSARHQFLAHLLSNVASFPSDLIASSFIWCQVGNLFVI